MSKSILFSCVLGLFGLALPLMASTVDEATLGDRLEGSVRIAVENRESTARLLLNQVHLSGAGFDETGILIVIFRPTSKQFWWMYQRWNGPIILDSVKAYFLNEYHVASDGDALVVFAASGRTLSVGASSDKFPSLEAGIEHARTELASMATSIHRGKRLFTDLNLSLVLPEYFNAKGMDEVGAAAGHGLIVRTVKKTKDGWDVEVGLELAQGIVRNETRMVRIDNSLSKVTALPGGQEASSK